MKKFNKCYAISNDDSAVFCSECGSNDFSQITLSDSSPSQNTPSNGNSVPDFDAISYDKAVTNRTSVLNPEINSANVPPVDINDNGNVINGVVGAFLFSIIGGAVYFLIYQLGYISSFSGLIMYVLANVGYGLFARAKNKASIAALISSVVATVIMTVVAEYFCLAFEFYDYYIDLGYEVSFFDIFRVAYLSFSEPELVSSFVQDIVLSYVFALLPIIPNIVNVVKARNAATSKSAEQ